MRQVIHRRLGKRQPTLRRENGEGGELRVRLDSQLHRSETQDLTAVVLKICNHLLTSRQSCDRRLVGTGFFCSKPNGPVRHDDLPGHHRKWPG